MPRIITFTAPKGGCGSTFVSASLCYMFVQKSQRVLALDMCFERCTLDSALGFQNDYVYTLKDVTDGECTLKEAVCSFDGVDFVRCGYEKDCPDYEKIADVLIDEASISPDSQVTQDNLISEVKDMLDKLSQKERDIVILRYGLNNDGQKKTLEEIGSIYNVSRERVRQIENRAICKLKKMCRNSKENIDLKNYLDQN